MGAPARRRGAARLVAPLGRARRRRERAAVLARRLGREARRLRDRGGRAVDGAALHRPPRPPLPSPRAALARTADAGSALGLVGVAVLAGGDPAGGWWAVAGTLAVVLSSLAYASGAVIGQRSVGSTPGPVLATGAMIAAALSLLPFAVLQRPTAMPDTDAILSLLALALLGTALAQLVLYRTDPAVRRPAHEPRHVPDARVRPRLRRRAARRVDHRLGARRAGADPRRGRARVRLAPAALGRARIAPRRARDDRLGRRSRRHAGGRAVPRRPCSDATTSRPSSRRSGRRATRRSPPRSRAPTGSPRGSGSSCSRWTEGRSAPRRGSG